MRKLRQASPTISYFERVRFVLLVLFCFLFLFFYSILHSNFVERSGICFLCVYKVFSFYKNAGFSLFAAIYTRSPLLVQCVYTYIPFGIVLSIIDLFVYKVKLSRLHSISFCINYFSLALCSSLLGFLCVCVYVFLSPFVLFNTNQIDLLLVLFIHTIKIGHFDALLQV